MKREHRGTAIAFLLLAALVASMLVLDWRSLPKTPPSIITRESYGPAAYGKAVPFAIPATWTIAIIGTTSGVDCNTDGFPMAEIAQCRCNDINGKGITVCP